MLYVSMYRTFGNDKNSEMENEVVVTRNLIISWLQAKEGGGDHKSVKLHEGSL